MGIKHNYQSGTANDGAKEVSSTRWNEDHNIDGPVDLNVESTSPSAPSSTKLRLFTKKRAAKSFPFFLSDIGSETALQNSFCGNNIILFMANNGSTGPVNLGMFWSNAGTVSHPAQSAGSLSNRMRRILFTTAATTGAQAGPVAGVQHACREGGFLVHIRFSITTYLSDMNFFVGLSSSLNPLAADPAGAGLVPNLLGIVKDSADTSLHIVSRTGTGTATKASLSSMPSAGDVLDFYMYCAPGSSTVYMRLVNLTTNTVLANDTAVTATLPDATTMLAVRGQIRTSQNAACALAIGNLYVEQDA